MGTQLDQHLPLGIYCSPADASPSFAPVQHFSFPAVPEPQERPPAPEPPKIVWPACHDAETAKASAETAEAILSQLPLRRTTVVAITSPGDGDGKTSLMVSLAPQLAKRAAGGVLAVDANFNHPSLTSRLSMATEATAHGQPLIYPTNLKRLSVLPAPPQSQSLVFSDSWIEDLRDGWSLVLLDMASLAHAEVTPLANCCDGVCLVVRLGHTSQRAVRESARTIHASGGRLLGCVVVE
jgi:Mrp family chromosome partitioning ATPase